jgi:hypothetical protein
MLQYCYKINTKDFLVDTEKTLKIEKKKQKNFDNDKNSQFSILTLKSIV